MDGQYDKILLILDLDETLIHASESKLASINHDFVYAHYFVYKRQGLDDFFHSIKDDFKVGVWSSASDDYVNGIAAQIFPGNFKLDFIWGRSRCTFKRNLELDTYFFAKPLKKLKRKGYALERILIIDDTAEKVKDNFGNAIYIKEFTGTPDNELKKLSVYLQTLKATGNVRLIEKRRWHLDE